MRFLVPKDTFEKAIFKIVETHRQFPNRKSLDTLTISEQLEYFNQILSEDAELKVFELVSDDVVGLKITRKTDSSRLHFIPIQFYNTVLFCIDRVEIMLLPPVFKPDILRQTNELLLQFYIRLISADLDLKAFYLKYGKNENLLIDILSSFEATAAYTFEYKTTGKTDEKLVNKFSKKLNDAKAQLLKSPRVWINIQWEWQRYLESLGLSCQELQNNSVINGNAQIIHMLTLLANYTSEISSQVEKDSFVKQPNSKDASIHYTSRQLKKVLMKHQVDSRKQVGIIAMLINVVMNEKYSTETIRKQLSARKVGQTFPKKKSLGRK